MNTDGVELLSNASATSAGLSWKGGRGFFSVAATFGGGNVALQYLGPDNTTWLPVNDAYAGTAISVTAAGGAVFELPPGLIRAAVTTATAVYARADRIPY